MTPSPSFSSRSPFPIDNDQDVRYAFSQPVVRAQENLIFAIKNIRDDEFDRYLDQALRDGASLDSADDNGLNPLELAVILQRPRVVQSLLARDAALPIVADDGFDLVMLAATYGHADMLSVLIEVGCMLSHARDIHGLTALHYAVLGDHVQAAITLLDRDADINGLTTDVVDSSVCAKSHLPPLLAGSGSTPLMFAVGKGHLALADLLLSRQADPMAGARHPLEIAVINEDVAMIDLLIQKGMDPAAVRLRNGQSLLRFALEQQCSLACMKKLLPPDTSVDDRGITAYALLPVATRNGQHEIAAYLLCLGVQAESVHDLIRSSWEHAVNLPDGGKMIRILVAARCAQAVDTYVESGEGFIGLYQYAHQPTELAIRGLFPELLTPLVQAMKPHQAILHQLTPEQQTFELAYLVLQINAPASSVGTIAATAQASANPLLAALPEQQLLQSIPEKITTQKKEIYAWARRVFDEKVMKIHDCYSRNFLMSIKASCPEGISLATFMTRQLRENAGLPDNLCKIFVSAWTAADDIVDQWSLPGVDADRISQCKEYYALDQIERLLSVRIQAGEIRGNRPSTSTELAYKVTENRRLPVSRFAQNPAVFLHSLEHPADQPSLNDAQLAVAFCLDTGLTPATSRAIVELWRNACQDAERRFPPSESARRHDFLSAAMARELKSLLLPPHQRTADGTLKPFPARWEAQLNDWCDVTLRMAGDDMANITPQADPEESRPFKRARTQ